MMMMYGNERYVLVICSCVDACIYIIVYSLLAM